MPFDSDYKFMATFHRVPLDGAERVIELVKGGPDVVLARCTRSGGPLSGSQVPIAEARADIDAANARMGEKGLRVLAFAARFVEDDELAGDGRRPDVARRTTSTSSGWSASSTRCAPRRRTRCRRRCGPASTSA